MQLRIERIFLKDASFEAPGGMAIFNESFRPEMQVDINTRVANRDEDRHEVVLSATVQAKLEMAINKVMPTPHRVARGGCC